MFKNPKTRKRFSAVTAVLCVLSLLVGVTAYFTDRESASAGATAGNMDMIFTDISASVSGTNGITSNNEFAQDKSWETSIVSDGAIINPGDYFDLSYELTNIGSKSMDIRQQLIVTSTVPMNEGAEEYQLTITGGNDTTAVTGTLSDDKLSITYDLTDIILDGSVETEEGATDGKYTVRLDFLRKAGNAFMGSGVTVSYKAQAKQHRNTDDSDWAVWAEVETKFEQINGENDSGAGSEGAVTLSGDGQTFYTLAPSTLTFRSTAPMDEFQEVKVNGQTIDPSNYTVTEGSTIITLSIDYLKTLDVADHEITVVSETGAPSAGFSVVEPDLNEHGFYYNQPYTAYVDAFGDDVAFFLREDGTSDSILISSDYVETNTYTSNGNNIVVNSSMGTLNLSVSADGTEIYCAEVDTTLVLGSEKIAADEDYIYIYDESLSGYVVRCIDKTQSSYGAIRTGINGKPTVALIDGMFDMNDNLIHAPEIPESVTTIGDYAFEFCKNMTDITIPSSVSTIGKNAFQVTTNLNNVVFEGTLEQWLNIEFGSGSSNPCVDGANLYFGDDLVDDVVIPDTFNIIDNFVFEGCTSLTSVVIPDSVISIGDNSFMNCSNLKSIEIPDSVTTIGENAFVNCTSLSSISVPSTVQSIGDSAFHGCKNLASVTFGDNSQLTTIGNYAFNTCTSLTSVEIPNSVTNIGFCAFQGCQNLTSIAFEGTMEQWNAISCGSNWNRLVPATEVICSDGTVSLS